MAGLPVPIVRSGKQQRRQQVRGPGPNSKIKFPVERSGSLLYNIQVYADTPFDTMEIRIRKQERDKL